MSKWFKFLPSGKAIAHAQKKSEEDNEKATMEQATAMNMAIQSAVTVQQVGEVNYKNGFSIALGNAFSKKGLI